MELVIAFIGGWAFTRAVNRFTRGSAPGSIANRIHIAVVGPWRPK